MKTMRRFTLVLVLGLVLAGQSVALAGEAWKEIKDIKWPRYITMLGASAGGNAILSVSAIAQLVSQKAPTQCVAQVTAGATQNMYLIEEDEGTYGWGSAQTTWEGKEGLGPYAARPVKMDLSVVAEYSISYRQIAVRKGSGIKKVQDLRGKRVVVGAPGGGTEVSVRVMMEGCGLYEEGKGYAFQAEYSGVQEGCEMIANGQADATIIGGTVPFSAFLELFLTNKIELIPFSREEVDAICAMPYGYSPAVIPAGSYEGNVKEDLLTVVTKSGLVCRSDLPEDEVYGITKIICENWEVLGTYHDLFKQMKASDICDINTKKAPIHPGALRYYKEAGFIK